MYLIQIGWDIVFIILDLIPANIWRVEGHNRLIHSWLPTFSLSLSLPSSSFNNLLKISSLSPFSLLFLSSLSPFCRPIQNTHKRPLLRSPALINPMPHSLSHSIFPSSSSHSLYVSFSSQSILSFALSPHAKYIPPLTVEEKGILNGPLPARGFYIAAPRPLTILSAPAARFVMRLCLPFHILFRG